MIIRLFVISLIYSSAQLGKHRHPDEFIFQPDGIIFPVRLHILKGICHRDGINIPPGSLMISHIIENRRLLRLIHFICGNHQLLSANHVINPFVRFSGH